MELDDVELKFSMIKLMYGNDDDYETTSYSIKDLINNAETLIQDYGSKLLTQEKEYHKQLKMLQKEYNQVKKENENLTQKLKEKFLL